MGAKIWRFLCALADISTWKRWFLRKPILNVAFITNMRDLIDRKIFLGNWVPPEGHFNGPRYRLGEVIGRTRSIDSVATDLLTPGGVRVAKRQFLAATDWAVEHGARVILLAAGTKRLFGDGKSLKERYPETIFTIGDNGTMLMLREQSFDALNRCGLEPGKSTIAVLGPSGFLGEMMLKSLIGFGYEVVGLVKNNGHRERIALTYGIKLCTSFEEMGRVDAVIACTHANGARLTSERVELIRKPGHKLLVVDVAEPSNMVKEEHNRCMDRVIRLDAGNAHNKKLHYVLGAISYRMFRLTRGVTFGCFAEALSLAGALERGINVASLDWFSVSEENMQAIKRLFESDGFVCPEPSCFGRRVRDFSLQYSRPGEETTPFLVKVEKHA